MFKALGLYTLRTIQKEDDAYSSLQAQTLKKKHGSTFTPLPALFSRWKKKKVSKLENMREGEKNFQNPNKAVALDKKRVSRAHVTYKSLSTFFLAVLSKIGPLRIRVILTVLGKAKRKKRIIKSEYKYIRRWLLHFIILTILFKH